jgi:hypothetical protein
MKKFIIVLFTVLLLTLSGCNMTEVSADTQKVDNKRFDVIYQQSTAGIQLLIILDKETNVKYLYTVEGNTSGVGIGLCKLEESK